MNKKIRSFLEHYLTTKIGVEIKCCLRFFLILCFYCIYQLIDGSANADIFHMLQMILLAYVMEWIQALIGSDFDELDALGAKEWTLTLLGSLVYAVAAHLGNWLDKSIDIEIGFGIYMVTAYLCTFLIYKMKRVIDAKFLNEDLKLFQKREEEIHEIL